jgi:hypothetical protein
MLDSETDFHTIGQSLFQVVTGKEELTTLSELALFFEQMDNSAEAVLAFDMATSHPEEGHSTHPCGTACCIGGWVRLLVGNGHHRPMVLVMSNHFGIPYEDCELMCFPKDAEHYNATSAQAAAMLRHYDATGLVVWND